MHLLWGGYIALGRYLQVELDYTAMHILMIVRGTAFALVCVYCVYHRTHLSRHLNNKLLYLACFFIALRELTTILGTSYVPATYATLLAQPAPLLNAFINRVWENKPLPPIFYPCSFILLVGAVLSLSGVFFGDDNDSSSSASDNDDDDDSPSQNDYLIGIPLLLVATVCTSIVFQVIAYLKEVPIEVTTIFAEFTVVLFAFVVELFYMDPWDTPTLDASLALSGMMVSVVLGVVLLTYCLREYGGPFVSSLISVRIVATVVLAWVLIGEVLETWLEWAGLALIAISATSYTMYVRFKAAQPAQPKAVSSRLQDPLLENIIN